MGRRSRGLITVAAPPPPPTTTTKTAARDTPRTLKCQRLTFGKARVTVEIAISGIVTTKSQQDGQVMATKALRVPLTILSLAPLTTLRLGTMTTTANKATVPDTSSTAQSNLHGAMVADSPPLPKTKEATVGHTTTRHRSRKSGSVTTRSTV